MGRYRPREDLLARRPTERGIFLRFRGSLPRVHLLLSTRVLRSSVRLSAFRNPTSPTYNVQFNHGQEL